MQLYANVVEGDLMVVHYCVIDLLETKYSFHMHIYLNTNWYYQQQLRNRRMIISGGRGEYQWKIFLTNRKLTFAQ